MQIAFEIVTGSRKVVTMSNEQRDHFYSVLFVNRGETATNIRATHSTQAGAEPLGQKATEIKPPTRRAAGIPGRRFTKATQLERFLAMKTIKPPYSQDGRQQLCNRCEKYCSRSKNLCPTCSHRDEVRGKIIAEFSVQCPAIQIVDRSDSERHLFAINSKNQGYFVVWNDQQVLDRPTYREIVAEARSRGLQGPLMIYGRICTYSGPGVEFFQMGQS